VLKSQNLLTAVSERACPVRTHITITEKAVPITLEGSLRERLLDWDPDPVRHESAKRVYYQLIGLHEVAPRFSPRDFVEFASSIYREVLNARNRKTLTEEAYEIATEDLAKQLSTTVGAPGDRQGVSGASPPR